MLRKNDTTLRKNDTTLWTTLTLNQKALQKGKHSKQHTYSFLIASNVDENTQKFSISSSLLSFLAILCIVLALSIVLLIFSYIGLLHNYSSSKKQLEALYSLNLKHKEQFYEMDSIVDDVESKISYLNSLESKINTMLANDPSLNKPSTVNKNAAGSSN